MARLTISRKPRIIDGFSEKQSAALFALFARNDDTIQQLAQLDASARVYTTDTVARSGQFLRASPPDSRGMALLLPSPDSTQPGDTISVSLEGPLGDLRVSCVPNQGGGARVTLGTVNGQERATFTTGGLIVFTSNGATGWTTAAEHPAESAAAPSITPTSSTEILPSNPSGSIWTWALRPFSVVLGRLAKQIGLTVIGNASDALAGLEAITATASRQALLSNSTGTAIGWRALEGADLPATSPYGWDDTLATDPTSNGHNPIVSVGDFLQLGLVGPTGSSPQIRSGDAVFRIRGGAVVSIGAVTGAALFTTGGALQLSADAGLLDLVAGSGVSITTGGFPRLTISGSTGEWTFPAGSSGQFWKHSGAANPSWASLALSDLPSQAADTFLGRLAGSGTPAVQLLSDIDSASIVYDAASHTFQLAAASGGDITRSQNSVTYTIANNAVTNAKLADMSSPRLKGRTTAGSGDPEDLTLVNSASATWNTGTGGSISIERAALTGEATASANANSVTVTRSTNFQSSPWTGSHQFNAAIVSGGEFNLTLVSATTSNIAIGAVSFAGFTPSFGLDTITGMVPSFDGQLVWIENESSTIGLILAHDATSTAANRFYLPSAQNFFVPARSGVWARYSVALDRWIISDTKQTSGFTVTDVDAVSTLTGVSNLALDAGTGISISTSSSGTAPFARVDVGIAVNQATSWSWTGTHSFGNTTTWAETGTTPSTSAGNGAYWVRNDTPCIPLFVDDTSVVRPLQNCMANIAATTTITAAITVLNCTTSFTVPANTARVGSKYDVEFWLKYARGATATAQNVSFFLVVGGNNINVAVSATTTNGASGIAHLRGTVTVLSTGAGGTCSAVFTLIDTIQTGGASRVSFANNATLAFNTTTAIAIHGDAQLSNNTASTSIQALGGDVVWKA